jgi:hypothetical protein
MILMTMTGHGKVIDHGKITDHGKTFFNLAVATLAFVTMFAGVSQLDGQNPSKPPSGSSGEVQKQVFDDHAATRLLMQFARGLEIKNQEQVLAAFDFVHMKDGELFQQQLISFLGHANSIRMHVNLVSTASDPGAGTAEADFEMEVDLRDAILPNRKQARLKFAVRSTSDGWKFVGLEPRGFFSTDSGE